MTERIEKIGRVDTFGRVLAGAALLVAGLDLAVHAVTMVINSKVDRRQDVVACINENILKQVFGVAPLNLEGCREEWQNWDQQLQDTKNVPTTIPPSLNTGG